MTNEEIQSLKEKLTELSRRSDFEKHGFKPVEEELKQAVDFLSKENNAKEVAEILGIAVSTVYRMGKGLKFKCQFPQKRKNKILPKAVVTDDETKQQETNRVYRKFFMMPLGYKEKENG